MTTLAILHAPLDAPPLVVPFDPADLDRVPPADIDVCDVCCGDGCLEHRGLLIDHPCHRCGGTGRRGAA